MWLCRPRVSAGDRSSTVKLIPPERAMVPSGMKQRPAYRHTRRNKTKQENDIAKIFFCIGFNFSPLLYYKRLLQAYRPPQSELKNQSLMYLRRETLNVTGGQSEVGAGPFTNTLSVVADRHRECLFYRLNGCGGCPQELNGA